MFDADSRLESLSLLLDHEKRKKSTHLRIKEVLEQY